MSSPSLKSIAPLQEFIARDVYPKGAKLVCDHCGNVKNVDVETVAEYFRSGWPKCCGRTMVAEKVS